MCEEVYNGNCEYCILPVENSAEGPLNSFSRLIDRFELKISATCDVPTNDGSRTTRFALLRRDLLPLSRSREQVLLFEFSVPLSEHPLTADLLNAASCCGLQLCRLDSRPYPGVDRSSLSTHFLFRVENGDLYSYLLYLFMEAPQFSPIGIYLHLDDEKKNTQTI